jgi:NADH dehydrogenase (ubiquinone) Fe-S protein 1
MLRQTLSRSALRSSRQSLYAARTFATSSRRQAEVTLTVGEAHLICGVCCGISG